MWFSAVVCCSTVTFPQPHSHKDGLPTPSSARRERLLTAVVSHHQHALIYAIAITTRETNADDLEMYAYSQRDGTCNNGCNWIGRSNPSITDRASSPKEPTSTRRAQPLSCSVQLRPKPCDGCRISRVITAKWKPCVRVLFHWRWHSGHANCAFMPAAPSGLSFARLLQGHVETWPGFGGRSRHSQGRRSAFAHRPTRRVLAT